MSTIFQSLNFPKYMLNYFIDFSFSRILGQKQGRNVYNSYSYMKTYIAFDIKELFCGQSHYYTN